MSSSLSSVTSYESTQSLIFTDTTSIPQVIQDSSFVFTEELTSRGVGVGVAPAPASTVTPSASSKKKHAGKTTKSAMSNEKNYPLAFADLQTSYVPLLPLLSTPCSYRDASWRLILAYKTIHLTCHLDPMATFGKQLDLLQDWARDIYLDFSSIKNVLGTSCVLKLAESYLQSDGFPRCLCSIWLSESPHLAAPYHAAPPRLIHPHTRQKVHSTVDIPVDVKPAEATVSEDGTELIINWAHTSTQQSSIPWPSTTSFPIDFLERQANPKAVRTYHNDVSPVPWAESTLSDVKSLHLEYDDIMTTDAGLLAACRQLVTYGILFVHNIPSQQTTHATASVPRLAERFGRIRETFYGRLWDVQSRGADSRNVAYTDLDLGLHIDLQYFESPPRYQILHMLRCRGVIGGESIFSDAFRAAYAVAKDDREAFDTLVTEPVAFHYENDGHHLYREHPTIQLAPPGSHTFKGKDEPVIQHINYSPPFQAPLPLRTAQNPKFLPSLKKFAKELTAREALFEYKMEEGTAVIFDNRRVLHGRREFINTSTKEWHEVRKQGAKGVEEVGVRWIKGCYIEAEGVLDRLNTLTGRTSSGSQ
ncbi:Clavaminate synthase-like protein [Clavulina sp. PMI_390]|nr:Clavaminate synthase-like protein [Clavulina sp. PMI_390]